MLKLSYVWLSDIFSAVSRPDIFMEDFTGLIFATMAAVMWEPQIRCRTLGKKAGYITYLGDALKAVFAILLVRYVIYPDNINNLLLTMYTGFGVVLGHNYPFYLKFKGGKGIAVTSGVMVAFDIRFAIPAAIGFFLVFFITRYVSLGSLVLSLLFPVCVLVAYPGQWHLFGVSVAFCLMAFWRHRSNIGRLLNGTENRFDKKKKSQHT